MCFSRYPISPGAFIIEGQDIAAVSKKLNESEAEEFTHALNEAIFYSASRSPSSDVEFAINLLIEIALRALSPGVNDTYTAVACIDRLSAALAQPVRQGLRGRVRCDDDGKPRVSIPGLTVSELIDASFHPLRRASADNILMSKHLLQALGRLYEIGGDDVRETLADHAKLIIDGAEKADFLKADLDFLKDLKKSLLA